MSDKTTVGSVTYQQPSSEYFEKRGLTRHARIWSLWALGVGAVIYFAAVGRHRLVLSPEEQFALSKGSAEPEARAEQVPNRA